MIVGGGRLARKMPWTVGMNVRITAARDGERTILEISGRLRSADLSELHKEIDLPDAPLVLNMSELLSADEAGIKLLRKLAAMGAELCGASGYVQMLLDDEESAENDRNK